MTLSTINLNLRSVLHIGLATVMMLTYFIAHSAPASAATSACYGQYSRVATSSWGCVSAERQGTRVKVKTFDVHGDGRCVTLYTKKSTTGSWRYLGKNCSGWYNGYSFYVGIDVTDVRIVRSDGRYYTSIYRL